MIPVAAVLDESNGGESESSRSGGLAGDAGGSHCGEDGDEFRFGVALLHDLQPALCT